MISNKKVYIVTEREYSYYQIVKCYATKEAAERGLVNLAKEDWDIYGHKTSMPKEQVEEYTDRDGIRHAMHSTITVPITWEYYREQHAHRYEIEEYEVLE
jgi:hypothetical protein